MSQPGENLQVRRTRKLLGDALVELIGERRFDRITVGQIAERAMVSRAAFYRNYRDKYHLVEQIFDEAMRTARETMTEGDERSPLERWVAFLEHVDAYHALYGALLGTKGSPWFAARMRASLADMAAEHFPKPDTPFPLMPARGVGLLPTVLSAMLVEAITWWLQHDRPSSPREIATESARLVAAVITEARSWNDPNPTA